MSSLGEIDDFCKHHPKIKVKYLFKNFQYGSSAETVKNFIKVGAYLNMAFRERDVYFLLPTIPDIAGRRLGNIKRNVLEYHGESKIKVLEANNLRFFPNERGLSAEFVEEAKEWAESDHSGERGWKLWVEYAKMWIDNGI